MALAADCRRNDAMCVALPSRATGSSSITVTALQAKQIAAKLQVSEVMMRKRYIFSV
jgi:hypothetical protein